MRTFVEMLFAGGDSNGVLFFFVAAGAVGVIVKVLVR